MYWKIIENATRQSEGIWIAVVHELLDLWSFWTLQRRRGGKGVESGGAHTKPTTTLAVSAASAAADSSRIKRETLEPREQPTRIMKLIWDAATVRQSRRRADGGAYTGIEIEQQWVRGRARHLSLSGDARCGRILRGIPQFQRRLPWSVACSYCCCCYSSCCCCCCCCGRSQISDTAHCQTVTPASEADSRLQLQLQLCNYCDADSESESDVVYASSGAGEEGKGVEWGALCAVAGAPQAPPRHGSTGVAAGVGKTHRCTTCWLENDRKRARERGRMRAIKFLAVVGVVSGKCCCCSAAAAAAGAHLMRRYFLRLPPAKRLACLPACTTRQPLEHSNSSSTKLKQGDQLQNESASEIEREKKRSAAIRGQE